LAPCTTRIVPLNRTCANCGTVAEADAVFCARCGLNFESEFKGTPLEAIPDASPVLVKLRENLGSRYVIERELGKGGMATVFLARDVKHDREVAIKVLHPDLSASIGAERFEREIKLAAKLQHPGILGLYDSGEAEGLLYYVMPFVRGESLRDRIDREGMLPIDDAVGITLQVADALGYAHEHGIVHRDIKPENILLAGNHVLVADFGIARAATEAGQQKLTQTGMAVGTPVYMAPEQSTGDAVGPTADLYSLGCMLYEMLAGEAPFTGPNAMAIMARHLMEQVPSVRVVRNAVPEELEQAIFIALNKQPVDRPQSAAQFAELLGMPLGATGTMRVMRGTKAMRPSAVTSGSDLERVSRAMSTMTPAQLAALGLDESLAPLQVPLWKRPLTWVVGAASLVAAAVLMLSLKGSPPALASDPDANRVAVLYFDDASPDSSLRLVADGLTEGLIRSLDRVSALRVISRSGVEPYRGSTVAVDSIARALSAGHLVRGSVAPEGAEHVRVSLALDHKSGSNVARTSLRVSRDSLLVAQDDVAAAAADLIRTPLGREIQLQTQRAGTASNTAWLAVQQGAQLRRNGESRMAAGERAAGNAAFESADSAFAAAEQFDRRWSEPVTRRAALAYQRSRYEPRDPRAIAPWVELAIGHADRALAIDPNDTDALEMRGTARYFGVLSNLSVNEQERMASLKQAQADLERATDLNSRQAGAWASLSHMYYQIPGKTSADVLFAARNALESDEFQNNVVLVRARLFNAAFDRGDFAAAEQYCVDLERRFAGTPRAMRCRLYLQSVPGRESYDIDRAWRLTDSLVAASPGDSLLQRLTGQMFTAATIARAAVRAGTSAPELADSARAVARRSRGDATIDNPRDLAFFGAYVYTVLGDREAAVRELGEYVAVNASTRGPSLLNDPTWMFRELVDDPGFRRLVGAR
jgi:serine/threonine-protein kinase